MAFGTSSAIFTQSLLNPIMQACWTTAKPTGYGSLSADTINAALYGNTGTPNKDDTLTNCAYNAGQWVTANEVHDTGGSNWPAGGIALATKTFTESTGQVTFGAANTAGLGNVTIANAYGCLVYDATISGGTVAEQGLCFNAFGGAQSVTAGTFTIQWSGSGGIFHIST